MAFNQGILGKTYITTDSTWTNVYQITNGTISSFTLKIVNQDPTYNVAIYIAFSDSATTPTNSEMIEWNNVVYPSEALTLSGNYLQQNKYILCKAVKISGATTPLVSVIIMGMEEDITL